MSTMSHSTDPNLIRWRAATWKLLLCFGLPLASTGAFYSAEQSVVQRPVRVVDTALAQPLPVVQYRLEASHSQGRKYHHVSGWIVDTANAVDWLQPAVLVVAPGGAGVEFRTSLRRRDDVTAPPMNEKQKSMAGFEVRMKKRYFPAGSPLRLYLVVQREGQRQLIDTQTLIQ